MWLVSSRRREGEQNAQELEQQEQQEMEKWRKLEQQEMEKWWRRAQGQDSDAHGETTQVQEGTHAASGKECTRERVEKKARYFTRRNACQKGG